MALGSTLIDNLNAGKKQTVVYYGTGLSTAGWTNLVTGWLTAKYPNLVTAQDSGMPGWNSNYALSYQGADSLQQNVLKYNPDTVFIEFAINDAVTQYNISPQQAKDNLNTMITRIRQQNPKAEIILQTMNSCWDYPGDATTPANLAATKRPNLPDYYQAYRDVAANNLLLIDNYPRWVNLQNTNYPLFRSYLPDGLHPNTTASTTFVAPYIEASLVPEPTVLSGTLLLICECVVRPPCQERARRGPAVAQ